LLCKTANVERFAPPAVFQDQYGVSIMYQQSLSMSGGRNLIRRIMEVDASVLLHSWSLAAAATGRANDRREICYGYGASRRPLPSRVR
jgi:hypothetical protein